jgi:allantoicase
LPRDLHQDEDRQAGGTVHDLLIDLASSRLGGRVLETSDEHFGEAARLIADDQSGPQHDGSPGWETHRRRAPGHEWAIVRLGLPGVVRRVLVDTTGVTGSQPAAASVEAIDLPGEPHLVDLIRRPERWETIVPRTPVEADSRLEVAVEFDRPATHLRLVLYPDGAVNRLRVFGEPVPAPGLLAAGVLDLAAVVNGGLAIDCSDAHFGSPNDMLLEDRHRRRPGWLTRRRRDGRHDWAIVRLAGPGGLHRLVVDTRGFVGNAPEACSVEGIAASSSPTGDLRAADWATILPRTPLESDRRHEFAELEEGGPRTHLRLSIYPDGGISRFAAFGTAASGWNGPPPSPPSGEAPQAPDLESDEE